MQPSSSKGAKKSWSERNSLIQMRYRRKGTLQPTATSKTTGSLTAKLAASTSTPRMHHLSGIPGPLRKRCSSAPHPCHAASASHSMKARSCHVNMLLAGVPISDEEKAEPKEYFELDRR
ncbi:hypothetical protein I7I51_00927 [Histoplasma capsulatum]|uniref:Uncharacterized protein n=1 Tax=Ajellomyces capsulatus TaxID=5037 RepID=A0A8A1MIC6_AJECA|nr:hypothetical protein I7I51_00927 [Histoplasma capsulatum]